MPRNRERKTNIGRHTDDEMRAALSKLSDGQTIKSVARLMNIPYTTLQRYNEKIKTSSSVDPMTTERLTPNYAIRRIFTDAQEKTFFEYLTKCSNMFYGLTLVDTRKLAYEMTVINNIPVPPKWHATELAGVEWLHSFRKRYPSLSLRTPEGCSLSRATSFNRHNVAKFYDNLEEVMSRHPAFGNGTRVYNLDETNTMTVQKSAKVLAVKGQKQVAKVTSAERGTLVTTCYIVNGLGNTLPPVMIFPRVHVKDHMIKGAPYGTLPLATSSGWMNGELFVKTMQHFIEHTNSSKENPSLLILDNHESHIFIQALNLAKENGVTILTVPPHSTGKLQPLDVGIFGPFKVAYNKAVDSWMMRHPGKTFSIYNVSECVNEAHMKVMTPKYICSAFKATGIFPFNRDLFTDDDFAPSEVTDRPLEKELPNITEESIHTHSVVNEDGDRTRTPSPSILVLSDPVSPRVDPHPTNEDFVLPSGSGNLPANPNQCLIEVPRLSDLAFQVYQAIQCQETPAENSANRCINQTPKKLVLESAGSPRPTTSKQFTNPFEFRGLPKAGPRKRGRTERRKGKSMIATDAPNKNEIEQRAEEKNKRNKRKKTAEPAKRKVLEIDSEEGETMSLYSEEEPTFDDEEDDVIHVDPINFRSLQTRPKEGNFILVEFEVKEKKMYYIAKVIGDKNRDIEVSFHRKSVKNPNKFHVPNVPDIATVLLHDMKMILPQPGFTGSTKRTQGLYHFDVDFSKINLR